MYRAGNYILARVFGLLTVSFLACIFAVQTPAVQSAISRKALEKFGSAIEGRISYDELYVSPNGALVLRNAVIIDHNPYTEDRYERGWEPVDTLLSAGRITARFNLFGLLKDEGVHISRAMVEDGMLHIVSEPDRNRKTNIERIFNTPGPPEQPTSGPRIFDIRRADVRNFNFKLTSFLPANGEPVPGAINFDDLDLSADVKAHGLKFSGGRMSGIADKCTAVENRTGYVIHSLTGRCIAGMGKTEINDLRMVDDWSDIRLKSYTMRYINTRAFADFLNSVKLGAEFRHSTLALNTLKYFTGAFEGNPSVFDITSGTVDGYVNDIAVEGLAFTEIPSGISGRADARVTGLPDVSNAIFDVKLDGLVFTTAQLTRLLAEFAPGARINLRKYAPGRTINVSATAKGILNRLDMTANLRTGPGRASANARISNLASSKPVSVKGNLRLNNLDIGKLIADESIGETSLSAGLGATFGKGMPEIRLDSLDISRLNLLGYEYTGLKASGELDSSTATVQISSTDPNLQLDLYALADLESEGGYKRYKIAGDIGKADLHALNVDNRGKVSQVSAGSIFLNLVDDGKLLKGDASLDKVILINDEGVHEIGDIIMRAHEVEGRQSIRFNSSFADADLTTDKPLPEMVREIIDLTVGRELSALFAAKADDEVPAGEGGYGNHELNVHMHDSRDLLSFLAPGVYIADNSTAHFSSGSDGLLHGNVSSSLLAFGKNFLKSAIIDLDNMDGSLNVLVGGDELHAGSFVLNSPALSAYVDDNDIALGVQFDSFSGVGGSGELYVNGMLYRDAGDTLIIKAHPLDSYIEAAGGTWDIGESDIVYDGRSLYINKFSVSNGQQSLLVDGDISSSKPDTLYVDADNIDLAIIDEFLPVKYGIKGRLDGKGYLTSAPGSAPGLLCNFTADSLSIGGVDAGTLTLSSAWRSEGEEVAVFLRNTVKGRETLFAQGSYTLTDKTLDITASMDNMPLEVAAPFVHEIISDSGGSISGDVMLNGPFGAITTSSRNLRLDDAFIRLNPTGVSYYISGPLSLSDEGLDFDGVTLRDDGAGRGSLAGKLGFSNLEDFRLDCRLDFTGLKLIDAEEEDGRSFYGHLAGYGSASVEGPFSALSIDAQVSTSGNGDVHIPLSGALSNTSGKILTFTEPKEEEEQVDPYQQMLTGYLERPKTINSDLSIKAHVDVSPEVRAFVEIDKSTGNVASVNGQGSVNVNLRPQKDVFDLNGDFNISEGKYNFVLQGILNKEFSIQDGSSVKFAGDLMDTQLNVTAKHTLKTSLSTLITDSTTVATRRLVECEIDVSDRLRAPDIKFAINIPDLDPTTRSQVESALNSEDKIQKQFVALLLMGSFIPSETSGVFNGTNMIYSNVTEVMSSQINSILQKLDIPLDFGFGYQENNGGASIFDVAISTQLFNNRVIVGGNLGNRRSSSSPNGDMVGDLDIEVKLDKPGKFRLNMFSHSADDYTSYLDLSQRNGIGFSYQKEYTSFREFLHSIFTSKKRREQEALEKAGQPQAMETITINYEPGKALSDTLSIGRD